jgi:hypothetical protein
MMGSRVVLVVEFLRRMMLQSTSDLAMILAYRVQDRLWELTIK